MDINKPEVLHLSSKGNGMRRLGVVVLGLLLVGGISHFAYIAGVNDAVGRSAYVNATFVRLEEEQCIRSNDMRCMKTYWRMRAGAAAASAKLSRDGFGGNSVEAELAEYIHWEDALPAYDRPKK
jgi:hypothetical protein